MYRVIVTLDSVRASTLITIMVTAQMAEEISSSSGPSFDAGTPGRRMSSTQLSSQLWFHLLRQLVRKRIEVLVEFREQAAPVPPYEPGRVFAAHVCPESLFRCEPSHSNVDA